MQIRGITRVLAVWLALAGLCHATDPVREAGLIQGVTSRYGKDESIWLTAGKDRFAALLRETGRSSVEGGIVLLHGIEKSPDDPELLLHLRTGLAEHGWTTLGLFAPVREDGAGVSDYMAMEAEYTARLQAATSFLAGKQLAPPVFIGQRTGAAMLVKYLAGGGQAAAAVLIDLPNDAWMGLDKVKVPILDIVAGGKQPDPDDQARQRRTLMKDNAGYQQLRIIDAGTDLGLLQDMLLNRIHGWLKRGKGP